MKNSASSKLEKQNTTASNPSNPNYHKHSSTSAYLTHDYNLSPSVPPTPQLSNAGVPNAPKVAIPRLRRPSEGQSSSKSIPAGDKNRVAHACEPCRHRKTKCSGERPVCQHCQDFKLTCVYMDGKRDRTKKQLGSLAGRVEDYERLLEELSLRVAGPDQDLIRRALDKASSSDEEDDMQASISPRGRTRVSEPAGEHKVSARVGSNGSMDRISEDFNRDATTKATGFYGKNSELTWIQKLKKQAASHGSDDNEDCKQSTICGDASSPSQGHDFDDGLTPINASSYHCDDLSIFVHEHVEPFEVPIKSTANVLFQSYLDTIHPSFPIIGKSTFMQQYNAYFDSPNQRRPNQNWLAILNMIFAIGARYSHLVQAEWRGDSDDHLVYFTRARMLGFNADAILGHAELQKVQITGLMAFYLMAIDQINRSWTISGIAIRHACSLGLNLRNDSKDVSDASKEIRYRVWWALCSTEGVLSVMTGRSASAVDKDCTAPLPLPMEEDSFLGARAQSPQAIQMFRRWSSQESRQSQSAFPTAGSSTQLSKNRTTPDTSISPAASQFSSEDRGHDTALCNAFAFRYHTRLTRVTNEVLDRLYRSDAMSQSWAQVQANIANLNSNLENWRRSLPPVFDFAKKQRDKQFVRQRMNLGFSYYSTLTIINRPCLCRIDRRIPDESDKAKGFNRETAARCVNAARGMLDLLPDEPNALGLYKLAPWWCLVHYLMQAATVLMLELSFRADHMPNEVEEIFDAGKKALEWLRSMSGMDEAARRASLMCNDLLRQVAPKVGREAKDATSYQPDGIVGMDGMNPIESFEQMQDMQDLHGDPGLYQTQPQYDFTTASPYQLNMFSFYDQMDSMNWSYGQMPTTSAPAPYDDMFPTGTGMAATNSDDNEQPSQFSSPGQSWFPGSGA